MSPETIGIIGIIVLLVLLAARMWIGLAMVAVGLAGIILISGFDQAMTMAGAIPFRNLSMYSLSAVPMFVFMGVIISDMGIGADLYLTAYKWVGQFRGGLAMATVLACALLGAITGISSAALVSMGRIALPEMKKYGYDDKLATGCIACSGTLALLIPPSLAFIMYGILTEQSIGRLFMAGIGPGILLAALFIVTIIILTRLRPNSGPPGPKTGFNEKVKSLKSTWSVLLLFILVLGGIYGGIFTPTEAGGVGACGALIIGIALRRTSFKGILSCIREAVMNTGMILVIMAGAFIFTHFMAASKVPYMLGDFVAGLNVPSVIVFAGIVLLYILLGMFLDIFSSIVLTIPIIFPVVTAMGFDPIWFGVVLVILIELGLVTPPIGFDVFVLAGMSGIPVGTVFRGVWPFCVADVLCIVIITIFPQIALFIPNMMMS